MNKCHNSTLTIMGDRCNIRAPIGNAHANSMVAQKVTSQAKQNMQRFVIEFAEANYSKHKLIGAFLIYTKIYILGALNFCGSIFKNVYTQKCYSGGVANANRYHFSA